MSPRILLLAALAAIAPELQAQVQVVGASTFQVVATGRDSVYVPLQSKDRVQNPRIMYVRRGNRADPAYLRAFTVSLADTAPHPTLRVGVDLDQLPSAGTYTVAVEVGREGADPQLISFDFQRPAARLAADPLVVRQVRATRFERALLGWMDPGTAPPLVIRETGARAPADGLTLEAAPFANDPSDPPKIIVDSGALRIERGRLLTPRYTLAGHFPLGVVKSTLFLRGPQLDTAISIPVEVTTRRGRWWLLGAVAVGLLLGWFVKRGLERQVTLGTARLRLASLAEQIRQGQAGHPDETFVKATRQLDVDILAAARQRDAAAITQQADALAARYATAITELEARRTAVTQELQVMLPLAGSEWFLPEPLAGVQARAEAAIHDIRADIEADSITSAKRKLGDLGAILAAEVSAGLPPSVERLRDGLVHLPLESGWLSASLVTQVATWRAEIEAALAVLATNPRQLSPEAAVAALGTLDQQRRAASRLLERMGRWMRGDATAVVRLLEQHAPAKPALDALQQLVDRFVSTLDQGAQEPESTLDTVISGADMLQDLERAWKAPTEVLEDSIEDESVRAAVTTLRNGGSYLEAARMTEENLATRRTQKAHISRGEAAASRGAEPLPGNLSLSEFVAPANTVIPLRTRAIAPLPPPVVLEQRIYRAQTVQTVLAMVFTAIITFLFYLPSFTGTANELVGVFFWSFGLDLGISQVLGLAPSLTRPTALA